MSHEPRPTFHLRAAPHHIVICLFNATHNIARETTCDDDILYFLMMKIALNEDAEMASFSRYARVQRWR